MEKKYSLIHKNLKVDVVEARADSEHDVQISVLGEPGFTAKAFGEYRDTQLESEGWSKLALVNGSLFFPQGSSVFANGVEKSMGVVHENDDATWDNNAAFYHERGVPFIHTQKYIKSIINQPNVRGAVTAAFGLLNNGAQDISGAKIGQPSRGIYLQRSGRTIVGKRADNTIVIAVFDGVTGVSGLTGYETFLFARDILKLRNAVCMDGGGSTYLEYKGAVQNGTSRQGPNAIAIYIKKKPIGFTVGDKVRVEGVFTIQEIVGDIARLKEVDSWVSTTSLQKEA